MSEAGTFRCLVIAPSGKMLDCTTSSVIVPAHDGYRGILANHMPLFCEMGLGIVEIKSVDSQSATWLKPIYILIDGGFALFASNLLTVLVYDAINPQGLDADELRHEIEKAEKKLNLNDTKSKLYLHDLTKSKLLEKLPDLCREA